MHTTYWNFILLIYIQTPSHKGGIGSNSINYINDHSTIILVGRRYTIIFNQNHNTYINIYIAHKIK